MSHLRRAVLPLLLAVLAAGCGWHLRGAGSASLSGLTLAVESRLHALEPRAALIRGLRTAGATVSESRGEVDAVLVLAEETVQRRVLANDPSSRIQEVEIGYRLRYALERPDGEVLADDAVTTSQVYRADRDNVLSGQAQEERVTERLRQDAVRLLLPRVQAALKRP